MTIKTTKMKAMSWVPREGDEHTSPVGVEMVVILPALLPLTAVSSGHVWAVQARSIGFIHLATTGIRERTFLSTAHMGEALFHKAMGRGMIQKPANTFEKSPSARC
jgi:hypothetical protein